MNLKNKKLIDGFLKVFTIIILVSIFWVGSASIILATFKKDNSENTSGLFYYEGSTPTSFTPQLGDLEHGLPIIEINTANEELPANKTDYVNSSFKISNTEDDAEYGFEVTMKENYGDDKSVGIRLRGNSTMGFIKKPFRIKFDKKQSFFGSPIKSKNWVLLADYLDVSLIKNYTAMQLAQIFDNLEWSPLGTHVALYLNNQYQGVYLLCDQIDEKEGRINIEDDNAYESGQAEYPFLVEVSADVDWDPTVDRNDVFYISAFMPNANQSNGSPAEIKYPEFGDGRPTDATEYISDYINDAFTALFEGDLETFEELVDIDSFIDYILINEITYNSDAVWKSIYITKRNGEKMKFGPIWDFDGAFGGWSGDVTSDGYREHFKNRAAYLKRCLFANKYLENMDEEQYQKIQNRYNELYDGIIETAVNIIDYKRIIENEASYNFKRWYWDDVSLFYQQYNSISMFFIGHSNYLKDLFLNEASDFYEQIIG